MLKHIILPLLAVLGGGAGFFLRRWQLATAFEPDTGLPISGAPATPALLALTVGMALLFVVLLWGLKGRPAAQFDAAFAADSSVFYIMSMVMGAFLLLGGTAWYVMNAAAFDYALAMRFLLPVAGVLSAGSLLMFGKNNYRAEGHGQYSVPLLILSFSCCLWLILTYQQHSSNPVLMDYFFGTLSIVSILLALYFITASSFSSQVRPRRIAFFSLWGVFLSLIDLADAPSPHVILFYLAAILFLLPTVSVLLRNVGGYAPRRLLQEPGDLSESNPETNTEEHP